MSVSFPRKLSSSRRSRSVAAVWFVLVLLLTAPAIGACTAENDQRAVQPGQVLTARTPTVDPSIAYVTPPSTSGPSSSPTTLTGLLPTSVTSVTQPAPSRAYFIHGGDLWQIPFGPGDAVPVITGKSILAFASSPDAEQVAVVYLAPDTGKEHLADLNPDGTPVIDVELALSSGDHSSHGGDIQSIAWAPSGDRVAVARQDGSIAVVTNDGTISQIVEPDPHRFPGGLSFSSDGQTLLFLDPDLPGRATSLYAISIDGGNAHKLIDGTSTGHPVLQAHWLPGGNVIAYSQAVATSPPETGDVYSIDAGTTIGRLVIPSAEFAPVAGIGDFAFAPDGQWAAFTLYVPDEAKIRFHGLYLMNLLTGEADKVEVTSDQAVTDLWWGENTLIYRTVKAVERAAPEHYTGVEPYWLYAVSTSGGTPTLRHASP